MHVDGGRHIGDPFLASLEAPREPSSSPCTHASRDGAELMIDEVQWLQGHPSIEIWIRCDCGAVCHIDQDAGGLLMILDESGRYANLFWEYPDAP